MPGATFELQTIVARFAHQPRRPHRSGTRGGGAPVIRILIADDHSVVRQGLRMFLALDDELEVIGEAGDGAEAVRLAHQLKPDVVFNVLHATPVEDGTVQGQFDLMGIPYTHSGVTTSAVAIDKELTKAVLVPHGVRMPRGKVVASETLYEGDPLPRPYVLKPVNEGSSAGVAIVTRARHVGQPNSP